MKCTPKSDNEILSEIKQMFSGSGDGELAAIKLDIQIRIERNKLSAIRAWKRYNLYDQVHKLIEAEFWERKISK